MSPYDQRDLHDPAMDGFYLASHDESSIQMDGTFSISVLRFDVNRANAVISVADRVENPVVYGNE